MKLEIKHIALWLVLSAIVFFCIHSYRQQSTKSAQELKELKELELRLLELQIEKLELELKDTIEIYIDINEVENENITS